MAVTAYIVWDKDDLRTIAGPFGAQADAQTWVKKHGVNKGGTSQKDSDPYTNKFSVESVTCNRKVI